MKPLSRAACLFALVVLAACASTEITERQRYEGAKLARPDRIIVYDSPQNPAEVPPESAFAAQVAGAATPTPGQLEVGRRLSAQVARDLVAELRGMVCRPSRPQASRRRGRTTSYCAAVSSRSTRAGSAGACWSGSAPARPS